MTSNILLRDVVEGDLPIFYKQQLDPEANYIAAFSAKSPADRKAFDTKWSRILSDGSVLIKTIVYSRRVAGHILSYENVGEFELSFWLGKMFWGHGIASQALSEFLKKVHRLRPVYARVAKDNLGSIHVLEKCGFSFESESKGFANARGKEIDELLYIRE